jgi:hypothetical protein
MIAALLAAAFLNPVLFFHGRSHGEGTLKIILAKSRRISVDSVGRAGKDGWLALDQTIREPGKPPRRRLWRFRQAGPNSFEGTLTDAKGPVRIDLQGDRLRIRYKDRKQLDFEQWLTPAGPRHVRNAMRVSRFGITLAHFDEVIGKLD